MTATQQDQSQEPLLSVRDLEVVYRASRGRSVQAVSGVSFEVHRGETLGVVGESGCGKSTTARAVLQMPAPNGGRVRFEGVELTSLRGEALRQVRPRLQMIFQDPISSLNPRRTVRELVAEGLHIWGRSAGVAARVDETLRAVGLEPEMVGDRRASQLSGGQCQRVSIARALVLDPALLVCDEPVSALDVSVQAQILNLLDDVRDRFGLTMVFISHDLAVIKRVSDRVMVMYLGKVCEVAPSDLLFDSPVHPYTDLLLRSVPSRASEQPLATRTATELPSTLDPPSGCRFRTRCPRATDLCAEVEPPLVEHAPGQMAACHHPLSKEPA